MAIHPDAVPEEVLDYDEILRRGGANCGDEDFALCKCPHCGHLYLIEYEVGTLYLDPSDLNRRFEINIGVAVFNCEYCGAEFPNQSAWIGSEAPAEMQVTWQNLAASEWRWVSSRTR